MAVATANIAYPVEYTSLIVRPLAVSQYKCLIPFAKWYPSGAAIKAFASKSVTGDRFSPSTIVM